MTPIQTPSGGRVSTPIVPLFLGWYVVQRPKEIVSIYVRYARAFSESFSMLFMLKTLLAPWKSIKDEYPSNGFNLEEIAATFFLNLTARTIGLLFRLSAIITGIVIQLALLLGFASYVVLWIVFPLLPFIVPFVILSR